MQTTGSLVMVDQHPTEARRETIKRLSAYPYGWRPANARSGKRPNLRRKVRGRLMLDVWQLVPPTMTFNPPLGDKLKKQMPNQKVHHVIVDPIKGIDFRFEIVRAVRSTESLRAECRKPHLNTFGNGAGDGKLLPNSRAKKRFSARIHMVKDY